MKKEHWLLLGLAVWCVYKWDRSQQGTSALDTSYANEAATLSTADGTNWTQSLWDPTSGQPAYMFGTVPVPSGTDQYLRTMGPASIYGHM